MKPKIPSEQDFYLFFGGFCCFLCGFSQRGPQLKNVFLDAAFLRTHQNGKEWIFFFGMLGFFPQRPHFYRQKQNVFMEYTFKGPEHHCLECGDPLTYGRANRKFCSDTCKNRWHNRSKSISWERYEQRIIRILERNHQILMGLLSLGIDSADMVDMVQMGFDFNYMTSYRKSGRRNRYACFEIWYEIYGDRVLRIEDTNTKKTGRESPSGK